MLKQSPLLDELSMHDVVGVTGSATELAFLDTKCRVTASKGNDCMRLALQDAKVVTVLAAAPKSNTMSPDYMFEANAEIIQCIAETCSQHCPQVID